MSRYLAVGEEKWKAAQFTWCCPGCFAGAFRECLRRSYHDCWELAVWGVEEGIDGGFNKKRKNWKGMKKGRG